MSTAPTGDLAERYVKLVLAVGVHDPAYVDAYYGPAVWRTEVEAAKPGLPAIRAEADKLLETARALPSAGDGLDALRARYLTTHLEALQARVAMLGGAKLSFDQESRVLYNAVAPRVPEARFDETLALLERLVPGQGPLAARVEALRKQLIIPPDRLDAVFSAAIAECRARTLRHLTLPDGESFTVEYVKGQPWAAYNWYKGDFRSVIQVNTDLPVYIDRAVNLACHEGYPGHHVYNALLEKELVRGRGFTELSIYPLFSPMSLIAEGTANYGIDMTFPGEQRTEYERRVLYPLAGLDPAHAALYNQVVELIDQLKHANNQAARRYLDGEIDAAAAAAYLTRYALVEPERARKYVTFIDGFRSYVINYNVGTDLVAAYVETRAGGDQTRRWEVFRLLLSTPVLAGDLAR